MQSYTDPTKNSPTRPNKEEGWLDLWRRSQTARSTRFRILVAEPSCTTWLRLEGKIGCVEFGSKRGLEIDLRCAPSKEKTYMIAGQQNVLGGSLNLPGSP